MATFGKTDDGESAAGTSSTTDKLIATPATPATSGKISSAHFLCLMTGGSTEVRCALYADSSGQPGARLAMSDEVVISHTSFQWTTFPFSGANIVDITGGTPYWIAAGWDDPGSPSLTYDRDNGADGRREASSFTYSAAFNNPFGSNSSLSGPVCLYITYIEPAGIAGPRRRQMGAFLCDL